MGEGGEGPSMAGHDPGVLTPVEIDAESSIFSGIKKRVRVIFHVANNNHALQQNN